MMDLDIKTKALWGRLKGQTEQWGPVEEGLRVNTDRLHAVSPLKVERTSFSKISCIGKQNIISL